jgi:hypothetical protein
MAASRNWGRRPAILAFAALLAARLTAVPAHAALVGTCTITVLSGGTLGHDPAIDTLGSREAGGAAAQVQVKANSVVCTVLGLLDCYRVSAPPPAAFAASPSGGDAGVAFSSSYSIDGGPDIAGTTQTEVLNGTYSVAVDLSADRASGIFPAGTYQALVTVRCE